MVDFKKDKLFQYGEEVWGIKNDGRPETIDKIINKTEEFFHSLGVKTKLSNYGITKEQTRPIVERFMERGWKLGEQKNITHDVVERILDRALS
ncbi:MAG TPA: iron-containing alcohol dehydrogenase, partial [Tenuifilaceae bacterium]|nr:iron-containing alcohol dehydrogenase [Tenuifilaceae bacterium]